MSDSNHSSSGIGFDGLLQITFIVLKLAHVINWAWIWVLAPAWITAGIVIVILIVIGIIALFDRFW